MLERGLFYEARRRNPELYVIRSACGSKPIAQTDGCFSCTQTHHDIDTDQAVHHRMRSESPIKQHARQRSHQDSHDQTPAVSIATAVQRLAAVTSDYASNY